MSELNEKNNLIKKLDLLLIILLAEKGFQQREIAKIIGMSTKTIVKIFGKNYEKLLSKNNNITSTLTQK